MLFCFIHSHVCLTILKIDCYKIVLINGLYLMFFIIGGNDEVLISPQFYARIRSVAI